MLPCARLAAVIVCAGAACKSGNRAAPPGDAAPTRDASRPIDAAKDAPGIRITLKPAAEHGKAVARRCAIAGDPIANACSGGNVGFALDRAGVAYIVGDHEIRRYKRVAGDACTLEPAGAAIPLPSVPLRAQKLDGPMFLRSGGPAWQLSRAGDAIYAIDFLAGAYRIDRGKPEPACTDVFGYTSVAQLGGRALAARSGVDQLAFGKHCTATPAKLDRSLRGRLYAIGDQLYAGDFTGVFRYDGTTKTQLGATTHLCGVASLAPCGDGLCVIDSSCKQLVRFDRDGSVAQVIEGWSLLDPMPWTLHDAALEPDGNLLLEARERDGSADDAQCEVSLYELPAAAFTAPPAPPTR